MKLSDSENCQHCGVVDFIEHFFFHCTKVKPLWKEIDKDIQAQLGLVVQVKDHMVLLGITDLLGASHKDVMIINHIFAIGRMVISKFKYGKQRNIIEIYETDCSIRKIWDN